MYKKSTQVPNVLLDHYLKDLSAAELKILLTVIRQTNGWVKRGSKARKTRDRISHSQFMSKTGLSRRVISQAISRLIKQGLIAVSDQFGNLLNSGTERSGRSYLFYTSTCALNDTNLCTFEQRPVQKVIHNKTNYTKLREGSFQSIQEVIANMAN